ncbi:hypothetical protein NKH77_16685 [Streptomyces sp. M19]
MLKKAFACASLAVAVTGAAGTLAPAATASDSSGGNYSQNINLVPHPASTSRTSTWSSWSAWRRWTTPRASSATRSRRSWTTTRPRCRT